MTVRSKTALFAILATLMAGSLHGFTVGSVVQRHYTDDQLTTLGEYFGRGEYYGRRTYLRTDAEHRGGLYLVARLDEKLSTLPQGTVVVLDIVSGREGTYKTFTLPLSGAKGRMGKMLYLGITNQENAQDKLLAWKITFQNSKGETIAERQSFLWTMPATK